jgi:hypothetical protein
MGQPTKELLLEILSEDSVRPVSSLSHDTDGGTKKLPVFDNEHINAPSPFKGEGWGEGKDHSQISGVVVGILKDIKAHGRPLVDFPGIPSMDPVHARSAIQLDKEHLGQDVVLMFDQGDRSKPIIMGILSPLDRISPESDRDEESHHTDPTNIDIDGERLTFTAKKEIVLKCGKASITLTKAGKILIRGAYLLSRSSGVNRVKGGSVQIN